MFDHFVELTLKGLMQRLNLGAVVMTQIGFLCWIRLGIASYAKYGMVILSWIFQVEHKKKILVIKCRAWTVCLFWKRYAKQGTPIPCRMRVYIYSKIIYINSSNIQSVCRSLVANTAQKNEEIHNEKLHFFV